MSATTQRAESEECSAIRADLLNHLRAGHGGFMLDTLKRYGDPRQVTDAQAAILALDEIAPQTAVTTIGCEIDFDDHVDFERLKSALIAVSLRHSMLRAYIEMDPTGSQKVSFAVAIEPEMEIQHVVDDVEYNAVAKKFNNVSIDPRKAPNWRVLCVRTPSCDKLLVIAHHAFVDAMSMPIFVSALSEAYRLTYPRIETTEASLVPTENAISAGVKYFGSRLAGVARKIEWPFAKSASSDDVGPTDTIGFDLPCVIANSLRQLAEQQGVTLFQLLLTLTGISLLRLTDTKDIVIGIPVSLRGEADAIGCFVDLFPHRITVNDGTLLYDCIAETARCFSADLAWRATGWRNIIAGERLLGFDEPKIDVIFGTRAPIETISFGPVTATCKALARAKSAAAVVVEWQERQDEIRFEFDFRTDVFTKEEVSALLNITEHVIISSAQRADVQVNKLGELSNTQSWSNCDTCNEIPALGKLLINGSKHASIESTLNRTAAIAAGEMPRRLEQISKQLSNAGIKEGSRVAVLMQRGTALPTVLVSLLILGAIYVPLEATYPKSRLAFMAEDANVSVVICDKTTESLAFEISAMVPGEPMALVVDLASAETSDNNSWPIEIPTSLPVITEDVEGRLAYICYTSGSSGLPKGVAVSRRALANLLNAVAHRTGFSSQSRLLAVTTLVFDIASLELLLPIAAGAELLVADEETVRDPWRLSSAICDLEPDVVQMTPSLLKLIVESGWQGNRKLEIWCGGEPLTDALKTKLLKRSGRLYNFYGPTETTIWSTAALITQDRPVNAGTPLFNTYFYVLDSHMRLRPPGVTGEIALGGAGVAEGYVGKDNITAERFVVDPLHPERGRLFLTGDFGVRGQDGSLKVLGRRDDQIKLNGHRIELGEIDAALASLAGVSSATCSPVVTCDGDLQIMAAVVGTKSLEPEWQSILAEKLPPPMMPTRIFFIDQLPLTTNGKTDRKAVSEILTELAKQPIVSSLQNPELLSQDLETLLQLFTRYTGQPAGLTDDFFRLGGDSISLVRLLNEIRLKFGTAPTVSAFLRSSRTPVWLMKNLEAQSSSNDITSELEALLDNAEKQVGSN